MAKQIRPEFVGTDLLIALAQALRECILRIPLDDPWCYFSRNGDHRRPAAIDGL
jgi:hypothetical protein